MHKSIARRTIAFVLAATFLFTALLVTACSCRDYRRDTFNYNEIVYERMNYEALESAFEQANSLVNDNYWSLVSASNTAVGYLNALIGDYQYVYVEYAKDTMKWLEEYTWISSAYSQALTLYYELLYNVLSSSNADNYFSDWSDEEKQLIKKRYEVMTNDEYLALQTEVTRLETAYNAISTSSQKEYANKAAEILIDLVAAYNKIAVMEGYDNYIEYAYENDYGRSYSPEDAEKLCEYVKEYLAPLNDDVYNAYYSQAYGVNRASAAYGLAAPLSSNYTDYVALSESVLKSYFAEIGDYMSEAYDYLNECNLYYQATATNNPNGLTGAFTTYLYNYDAPYIYQYCYGSSSDISTFVHEFGHFTSYYINGSSGGYDLDVAEVQSQANEMLFMPYYSKLFTNSDVLVTYELFGSLFWSVTMGCIFDEFQREIYTSPGSYKTANDINELFDKLLENYNADWYAEMYEKTYGSNYDFTYWWAEVSHTFQSPFYYISYAVSALPALTIYEDSKTDRSAAIAEYNYIQEHGNGEYTFDELLKEAGVASPFDESTLSSLADFIKSEIA